VVYAKKSEKIKELKKDKPPKKKPKTPNVTKGVPRVKTPAMIANPGGQPSKFDHAAPNIIKFIRKGNTYECAAGCSRVSYECFNNWMKQGKADLQDGKTDSKFLKFFQDVQQAEMDAEEEVLGHWKDCIPGNWQAGKEFLARRHPSRWGNQEKLDITSNGEKLGPAFFMPLKDDEE
jgi:hypothetical protein